MSARPMTEQERYRADMLAAYSQHKTGCLMCSAGKPCESGDGLYERYAATFETPAGFYAGEDR